MSKSVNKVSGRVSADKRDNQRSISQQEDFPVSGNVRPAQAAKYLSIGLSTLWLFVKQGRVQKPLKLSTRISCFPASYIRELAENGIPDAKSLEVSK